MLDWIIILTLVVVGIGLLVAEVIFIPGTTVVGIAGIGVLVYANYLAFNDLGATSGTVVLVVSIFLSTYAFYRSFKSGAWKRFALKSSNTGKVNEEYPVELQTEQRGVTLSALRPYGKAEFDDKEFEVRTMGDYLSAGTKIKIISIQGKRIYVEPLKDQ